MNKTKIILATHNVNKLKEFQSILQNYNFPFEFDVAKSYTDIEPIENGHTFKDNALIKAKGISDLTGYITLADDSGFCVHSIDNQPGIYSARWAENGNYEPAFKKIAQKLNELLPTLQTSEQNIDKKALQELYADFFAQKLKAFNMTIEQFIQYLYSCSFITTLCLYIPKSLQHTVTLPKNFANEHCFFSGEIKGQLSFPPKGENGFGYDPIFVPNGYSETFAQMESSLKNSISHRKKAINELVEKFFALQFDLQ